MPVSQVGSAERSTSSGKLRIVIAAGAPVLCEALTTLLSQDTEFQPISVAGSAKYVERRCEELRPDAIVVDAMILSDSRYRLLDSVRSFRQPPAVIAIVTEQQTHLVSQFLAKGAQAAVLTSAPSNELAIAIRWSVQGAGWISPPILSSVLKDLRERIGTAVHPSLSHLTARELEILQLMVDGLGRREMASYLCVSIDTIRTHVGAIFDKLDVHSAGDAAALAREAGLQPGQ